MPSASAAIDEMWLWNAVRSGITEPTTRPSRSAGLRPGRVEARLARFPDQVAVLAFRTPNSSCPRRPGPPAAFPSSSRAPLPALRPHLTAGPGPPRGAARTTPSYGKPAPPESEPADVLTPRAHAAEAARFHAVDAASIPERPAARAHAADVGLSLRDRGALTRILGAFLLTRLLLYVTGALADADGATELVAAHGTSHWARTSRWCPWAGWDSGWYLSIAERGYWFDPHSGRRTSRSSPLSPAGPRSSRAHGQLRRGRASRREPGGPRSAVLVLWRWVRAEGGLGRGRAHPRCG